MDTVRTSQGIPARTLKVKPIWISFHDDLYLEASLDLTQIARGWKRAEKGDHKKRLGLHSCRGWERHVLHAAAITDEGSQDEAIDAPAGTQLWWPPYTGEGGRG